MSRLVTVGEFDIITSNPEYENRKGYGFLDEPAFSRLVDFVDEFVGTENHADANEFFEVYKPKNRSLGDCVVSVNNYVGLIQLRGGYQIQVFPKIDFDDNRGATFLKMLRSLKDFPGKQATHADLRTDRMNLYEVFISMYIQEVRNLVKKGIKSSYVGQEDNLRFYKGKLLVSQHIKANLAHGERFFVSYEEFLPNRAENRLVKSTLLKLQKLTTSARNAKDIRQLLMAFEMVGESTNYEKDFSKIVIDRNTKDYEMLMKWSKVFLCNRSFSTFSGKTNSRAILFPMEKVYESYVAQQMKKEFTPFGWDVTAQDQGYYLFEEQSDTGKNKNIFRLRPDVVMRHKADGKVVVLDTKWKRLIPDRKKNYGITSGDMYQMYAYAKKYTKNGYTPEVWLLYPKTKDMSESLLFDSGDGVKVHAFFVDVPNIDRSDVVGGLKALRAMVDDSIGKG
ncbi:MAG: McrC family protein [Lachnospiraceae bacterium]|nr:McrC family protein [Candidatus Colinaster scatohippi]